MKWTPYNPPKVWHLLDHHQRRARPQGLSGEGFGTNRAHPARSGNSKHFPGWRSICPVFENKFRPGRSVDKPSWRRNLTSAQGSDIGYCPNRKPGIFRSNLTTIEGICRDTFNFLCLAARFRSPGRWRPGRGDRCRAGHRNQRAPVALPDESASPITEGLRHSHLSGPSGCGLTCHQIPPSTCHRPAGLSFLMARLNFLTEPSESLIS